MLAPITVTRKLSEWWHNKRRGGTSVLPFFMTEKMIDAGVEAYLENKDKDPDMLVNLVWEAMKDAKQKEALENYRSQYLV